MKTSQSLFPTTAKSKASFRKQPTYNVLKKALDETDLDNDFHFASYTNQVQQNNTGKIQNIFRDKNNQLKTYSIDENNNRPIGGTQLIRKYEKATQLVIEEQTKRLSKKSSKRNIKQINQKIPLAQFKSQPNLGFVEKDKQVEEIRNQTLKVHHDCKDFYTITSHEKFSVANSMVKYNGQGSKIHESMRRCSTAAGKSGRISGIATGRLKQNLKLRTQSSAKCSSVQNFKQSQADKNHLKWAQQQQHKYLDKMAILNEINYNCPLIQKLGNRYFEGILRNRYMDEPQYKNKSPYIYQIKDKMADTKFISKIKSMKCNFMERNKIVLKGKSKMVLEYENQGEERVKRETVDGRKRWQEFNDELFTEWR